jgi:hypothetical protein
VALETAARKDVEVALDTVSLPKVTWPFEEPMIASVPSLATATPDASRALTCSPGALPASSAAIVRAQTTWPDLSYLATKMSSSPWRSIAGAGGARVWKLAPPPIDSPPTT